MLTVNQNFDYGLAQVSSPSVELSTNGLHEHVSKHTEITVLFPFDVMHKIIEDLQTDVTVKHG